MKNHKILGVAILLFFFVNKTVAQNAKTFNLAHDYPTYLDVQFIDQGKALGAFESYTVEVKNISNADIACGIEFTINDNCGNSQFFYFPGGLNLKVGKSARSSDELSWKCKEYRIDSGNKFGIASVYCRVFDFKNLTEETNKYKEEQRQTQQKLDEEKGKREKIAFDREVQQIKEKNEKERILAEKESNNNSNSYSNSNTNSIAEKQPTWQERDAKIKEENQRKYQEQQERIVETQRRSEEQSKQLVEGTTELVGMIGNLFSGDNKASEKREARKADEKKMLEESAKRGYELKKQNYKEADEMITQYYWEAKSGKEFAVSKVMEAYDKKILYLDDSAFKAKISFLEEMYNINKSSKAEVFLKNYYSTIVADFKEENKRHISRSIQNLAWAGACYSIRIIVPKQIDPNGNIDGGSEFPRWAFGYGFAGYFAITGIVHTFRIGYKHKPKYIEANKKMEQLNNEKPIITFVPNYDLQYGTLGIAMKIKF